MLIDHRAKSIMLEKGLNMANIDETIGKLQTELVVQSSLVEEIELELSLLNRDSSLKNKARKVNNLVTRKFGKCCFICIKVTIEKFKVFFLRS